MLGVEGGVLATEGVKDGQGQFWRQRGHLAQIVDSTKREKQ